MIAKRLNQEGFSLLEVMIGMLVFSLGMLLLIPMVVTSISGNEAAHNNDMVLQDIQKVVEAYKARGLPDAGSIYGEGTDRYTTWWVQPITANLNQLNVEVTWFDQRMQYHFRRVSTFIYQKAGGA